MPIKKTITRGKQIIKLVFSPQPDISTPTGRSQDRYRRAALAALTSGIARVVNMGTMLATVPLVLGYLGPDLYGIYATIVSFIAFLTFTDMGIGIGLQNSLSESHGKDDLVKPRILVSSAIALMVIIAGLLIVIAFTVIPLLSLDLIIKTETEAGRNQLLPTVQAVIVAFAFGLPTGLIQRIYRAYQEGFYSNLWLILGRVMSFGGMLVCIWFRTPLWVLSGVIVGFPFLVMAFASVLLFIQRNHLRPAFSLIRWKAIIRLFHTSIAALICQVSGVIAINAPAIIIANRLGASSVTPYSVAQRLLAAAGMIFLTIISPLWPAYGEAKAKGDHHWVVKTFRRTVIMGILIQTPIFLIMVFWGRDIIRLWSGGEVVISWSLLMGINTFYFIAVWNGCCSIALSGLDRMKGQAVGLTISSIVGAIIAYYICPIYGVEGVIWTMALISSFGYGITAGIEIILFLKKTKLISGNKKRVESDDILACISD